MLAIVLVGFVVALVVHELAHWLAARAFGFGAERVRVRVRVRRLGPAVEAELDTDGQRIWFLLAGPITSVLFGVVLVAVGGWWGVVGAVSILLGVLTLAGTDGRQAWALARNHAKSNDSR